MSTPSESFPSKRDTFIARVVLAAILLIPVGFIGFNIWKANTDRVTVVATETCTVEEKSTQLERQSRTSRTQAYYVETSCGRYKLVNGENSDTVGSLEERYNTIEEGSTYEFSVTATKQNNATGVSEEKLVK